MTSLHALDKSHKGHRRVTGLGSRMTTLPASWPCERVGVGAEGRRLWSRDGLRDLEPGTQELRTP